MSRRIALMILASLVVVCPTPVVAETSSSEGDEPHPVRAQAEELFVQGTAALEARRYTEARDLLRRSLDLRPSRSSAFSLAVALHQTGETQTALSLADALLNGEYGELADDRARQVRALREQIVQDLATLHIEIAGAPRAEVRVDGELVAVLSDGERAQRQVSSGSRLVSVSSPGFQPVERRIDVERGGAEWVTIELVRDDTEESESQQPVVTTERRSVVRRAWFWVVIGLAAATVGVGIWLGVAQPWDQQEELYQDDIFGVTYTLSGDPRR